MKRMLTTGMLFAAILVSGCATGLGPDYRASREYVGQVLQAGDPAPTADECAQASRLSAQRAYMRQSDIDYLDRTLARCGGQSSR